MVWCGTFGAHTQHTLQVVGGWDSSNTAHLLEIPHGMGLNGYHVNVKECIRPDNSIEWRDVDGNIQVDLGGRFGGTREWSCMCAYLTAYS